MIFFVAGLAHLGFWLYALIPANVLLFSLTGGFAGCLYIKLGPTSGHPVRLLASGAGLGSRLLAHGAGDVIPIGRVLKIAKRECINNELAQ